MSLSSSFESRLISSLSIFIYDSICFPVEFSTCFTRSTHIPAVISSLRFRSSVSTGCRIISLFSRQQTFSHRPNLTQLHSNHNDTGVNVTLHDRTIKLCCQ